MADITNNEDAHETAKFLRSKNSSSNNPKNVKAAAEAILQPNQLSNFSSYNYCLTLYMLSPQASAYFSSNGKLPATDDGVFGTYYVIAQSGGINSNIEKRGILLDETTQEGLDYYIDNLNVKTVSVGKDGFKVATTSTTLSFTVTEPTGFTFLTRLQAVSDRINKEAGLFNGKKQEISPNLYQQHFMLGIKFYGYDEAGNVVQSSNVPGSNSVEGDENALFQRLFPFIAEKVQFAINGKAVTYQFETVITPESIAFGVKRALVQSPTTISGRTVRDAIDALFEKINTDQRDLYNQKKLTVIPAYSVKWISNGVFDANLIADRLLTTEREVEKETSGMSQATTTSQSNVKNSSSSESISNNTKTINVPGKIPIVQAIDNIISKSSYIADTLKKQISSDIEASEYYNPVGELKWFSIKPVVEVIDRDITTKDWVYNVTYEIFPYTVPYIRSPYVASRSKYYGPVKKYEYFFTGKNTEVISFSQAYNNLYFTPLPVSISEDTSSSEYNTKVPMVYNDGINSDPTMGSLNRGDLIADSIKVNLYSITDTAQATIRIMGDPAYLMQVIGQSSSSLELNNLLLANNSSLNPYGGQLFIEIIFNTAEDYQANGLLNVNSNIKRYDDTLEQMVNPEGMIYQVNEIESTFIRGKFEQTLSLTMVPRNELITSETSSTTSPAAANSDENKREVDSLLGRYKSPRTPTKSVEYIKSNDAAQRLRANFAAIDPRRVDLPKSSLPPTDVMQFGKNKSSLISKEYEEYAKANNKSLRETVDDSINKDVTGSFLSNLRGKK